MYRFLDTISETEPDLLSSNYQNFEADRFF